MNWTEVKEIANRSLDEQAALETGKVRSDSSIVGIQSSHPNEPKTEGTKTEGGVEDGIREIKLEADTNDKRTSDKTRLNLEERSEEVEYQQKKPKKISFEEIDQHARDVRKALFSLKL